MAAKLDSSPKMASYLSRFSPVPTFPEYTGPYKVGTMDVEIAVSELISPASTPEEAADIPTVQFRIFYPATDDTNGKPIPWLPTPQRPHVSGYTEFIGISKTLAGFLSFLPRHLYYSSIPVHKNAAVRQPETENKRWPTMIFSHGLGGTRNSYSYIAGSLASHGVVVFCPEHRDGSAVASFIRVPGERPQGRYFAPTRRSISYRRIPHEVTDEVYEAREGQLRVRLWETALIHEAILNIDAGARFINLNTSTPTLHQFMGRLNVNEPGSIIFAGHSFGSATMYQLLKSTYYADRPELAEMEKPLFRPAEGSAIRKQVTEKTVTMLLDMWCMPLLGPNCAPLFSLPLPLYDDVPSAAGGNALLAVESEAFFKWKEHLNIKARLLSPNPSAKEVVPTVFERPSGIKLTEPNFFYVENSAHLNQSDFGVLFPWLTKKIFSAEQPERALRLNLRAQLQLFRANGIPIARTCFDDLIDGSHIDKLDVKKKDGDAVETEDGLHNDKAIFDRSANNTVECWNWIDIIGLGDMKNEEETGKTVTQQVEEAEEEMKGQLEPYEQTSTPAATQTLSAAVAA
ncbi:unnamed protein product [Clonostachys chloroleuca]|uniref:Putative phospholipase n=1 Tax=Clonostachys chloroleuca TaxID=1926264 RepID=A0AA35Q928_9HYPO|nr:unnamed protein product [Clonostachys chloroleuca]